MYKMLGWLAVKVQNQRTSRENADESIVNITA